MSAVRAGAAYVELFAKDSSLIKGLNKASARLKSFGKGVGMVGGAVAAAGTAVLAPIVAMANTFAATGDAVQKMALRTGLSAEAVSTLGYAAEQSGTNVAGLEAGFRGMQKQLLELSNGATGTVDTFAALGLSMDDMAGKTPEEQFKLIADKIAGVADPATRAALAMKIFGDSGAQLLPLMSAGAAGIEALQAEADSLNLTIDQEAADSAAAYGDAMDRVNKTLRGVAVVIGGAVAPIITDLANLFAGVISGVISWARENKALVTTIFKVAAGVVLAGTVLAGIGVAIVAVGTVLGGLASILAAVGAMFGFMGTIVAAILTPVGLLVAGVLALGAYLLYASGAGSKAMQYLAGVFGTLKTEALSAFGAIGKALMAGDIAAAGEVLWALLRLQWTKGIVFLEGLWSGFKDFLASTASAIVYATAGVFVNGAAAIAKGWVSAIDFLADTWAVFANGVRSIWNNTVGWLEKAWVRLTSLIDSGVDVDAEINAIDNATNAKNAAGTNDRNQEIAAREAARKKRFGEIDANADGMTGTLGSMKSEADAERQRRRDAADAITTDAERDVEAARAKFDETVANANALEKTPLAPVAETVPVEEFETPEVPEVPEIEIPEVPDIEIPEVPEMPDLELSGSATDSIDGFGDEVATEVTAGFDAGGMGFGSKARAIERKTPDKMPDRVEQATAMIDTAAPDASDPMQTQLDDALASMQSDPATTAAVAPMANLETLSASANVIAANSLSQTAPMDAVAREAAAMPADTQRAILNTAASTAELVTIARRGGLRFA